MQADFKVKESMAKQHKSELERYSYHYERYINHKKALELIQQQKLKLDRDITAL